MYLGLLPNQHEVCQPNEKPLSNPFGDTMAYHMYLALEESVRFELTEHYCSSVFKTDALNQTLPTFHMALGARLELATLWLTARCSTVELPKNKWRMVQDLNLWLFCNNISLAKKLNKPL